MKSRLVAGVLTTVLLLCGASTLEAQRSGKNAGPRLVQILDSKSGSGESSEIAKDIPGVITVTAKTTPRYELSKGKDAPELKYSRPWLEVAVPFKTNAKAGRPWIDNAKVKVELIAPVVGSRGAWEWGVLNGSFELEPVANIGEKAIPPGYIIGEKNGFVYHMVRFYISPGIISRYFVGNHDVPKNFEKILSGIPVRVTFEMDGVVATGIKPAGKDFADFAKKLTGIRSNLKAEDMATADARFKDYDANGRRGYFELFDVVLSSTDSPWAWIDYERQEHTKKSESGR